VTHPGITGTGQPGARANDHFAMAPTKEPTLKQSTSPQEHYKRTVARLANIQSHLTTVPRSGKLRDKVAIITGVGSLKGIGYNPSSLFISFHDPDLVDRRAAALLFAHEGR